MLQDKLGLACQQHTEITGYTIGAQTHTNPTSTNNFAYLTGRNFGLTNLVVGQWSSGPPGQLPRSRRQRWKGRSRARLTEVEARPAPSRLKDRS